MRAGVTLHAKGVLKRYTVGHLALNEVRSRTPMAAAVQDRCPHYWAAGPVLDAFDPPANFSIGLDAILTGLIASPLTPPRARSSASPGRRDRRRGQS
jgi:hypothetical protein